MLIKLDGIYEKQFLRMQLSISHRGQNYNQFIRKDDLSLKLVEMGKRSIGGRRLYKVVHDLSVLLMFCQHIPRMFKYQSPLEAPMVARRLKSFWTPLFLPG